MFRYRLIVPILFLTIVFNGCGGAGGSCLPYSNIYTTPEIITYSECGGFSDRNTTETHFADDKTYVAYSVDDNLKSITITHYNKATDCRLDKMLIDADWDADPDLGSDKVLNIYAGLPERNDCYCLRDVKLKVAFDKPQDNYYVYIVDKLKSEDDPKITFNVNTSLKKEGIVSFPRSVAPWKRP